LEAALAISELPAGAVTTVPRRRAPVPEVAKEIERRGRADPYAPSTPLLEAWDL